MTASFRLQILSLFAAVERYYYHYNYFILFFIHSVSMFPREFKNWKYEMQVGTTISLCDQRPADSRAAKWR